MSEWKEKSLAEIAENKAYAIVDGPFGTQLHASEYQQEGIPVVRVVNTTYDGRFDDRDLVYISETKANSLKRSEVIPGDVIVAKTGATIGKSGIFPSKFPRAIVASSCLKISVDTIKADNRFVLCLIESHEGQRKIIDSAGGSTRTTINIKPFSAIRFVFPDDKDEQTQIADILFMIDRAIEQTESIIEKQTRIKTGLMQDLLTKGIDEHGNVRSEETHEFKDSPLGRIPAEWDSRGIISYLQSNGGIKPGPFGSSITKDMYTEKGYRVYGQEQAIGGSLSIGNYYISEGKYRSMHTFSVQNNDVLISLVGTIGHVLIVREPFEKGIINPRLLRFRPNLGQCIPEFLRYLLLTSFVRFQLERICTGGTMQVLSGGTVKKVIVPVVKLPEQNRIVEVLMSSDLTIEKERSKLAKLRLIKQGLMQDLLYGKVLVTELLNKKKEIQQVI